MSSKNNDLENLQALNIVAAMRELSLIDGEHPSEKALIDAFEAELSGVPVKEIQYELFDTPELKGTFLRSLILVALADGSISPEEKTLLQYHTQKLGLGIDTLEALVAEQGIELLSHFKNVKTFKNDVIGIGEDLGLDMDQINKALSN